VPLRLDNVGIVVEDLKTAIEFFRALGLELEGRGVVERRVGRARHRSG
jgi:catechol 2,3-dioxygenase-like lactoylglutathione lyase family enzyme